jgi:hypothetical protein
MQQIHLLNSFHILYNRGVFYYLNFGMNCTLDPLTNQAGQCIFKVNGEVTHVTSKHLHPAPNERHQYSQLFMLDSSTAVAKRLEHQASKNCKKKM